MQDPSSLKGTRRDFLASTGGLGLSLITAASVLSPAAKALAEQPSSSPYGPFKMGIQSYSLRGYKTAAEALAKTKELGLHYWESFRSHVPITSDPSMIKQMLAQLAASDVKVAGYGVLRFTDNLEENRGYFEFAKAMGIEYLSADPDPGSFDALDKLVEQYDIAVGIHNHGPGHRYATIESIEKAIKDHHPKIGVCNDTGHFLRSGIDPVHAVEVFGKRTYGVHLKDVKGTDTFTILGGGDLRTVDLLRALKKINYSYCLALEYEEHPEDPMAEIQQCLAATQAAVAKI